MRKIQDQIRIKDHKIQWLKLCTTAEICCYNNKFKQPLFVVDLKQNWRDKVSYYVNEMVRLTTASVH